MNIGRRTRGVGDDYTFAVDYSQVDVYVASPITAATAAADTAGVVTLGAVTVAGNVCTFRVTGSVRGTVTVTVSPTNAASPPNLVPRSFTLVTE